MVRGKKLIQCNDCLSIQYADVKSSKHLCLHDSCNCTTPAEVYDSSNRLIPDEVKTEIDLLYCERNELMAGRLTYKSALADLIYQSAHYSKLPNQKKSCELAMNKINQVRIPNLEKKIEDIDSELKEFNFVSEKLGKFILSYDLKKEDPMKYGASGDEDSIS